MAGAHMNFFKEFCPYLFKSVVPYHGGGFQNKNPGQRLGLLLVLQALPSPNGSYDPGKSTSLILIVHTGP